AFRPLQQISSHSCVQFAAHWAAVGYDLDPQYQRQAPNFSSFGALTSFGALMSVASGAVTEGAAGVGGVGTVALAPIESISTQSRGSTESVLLIMMTLLWSHDRRAGSHFQSGKSGSPTVRDSRRDSASAGVSIRNSSPL